jgi:hypothetical protein
MKLFILLVFSKLIIGNRELYVLDRICMMTRDKKRSKQYQIA